MYDLSDLAPTRRNQILNAKIPDRFIGLEFSDLGSYKDESQKLVQNWMDFVNNGDVIKARGKKTCGLGLLLVGKPGHGKTTLASVVLQDVLRNIDNERFSQTPYRPASPGLFIDYPKLLRVQQRSWKDESGTDAKLIDRIYGDAPDSENISILVLDDLGKEHRTATNWAEDTFDALLRSRYNAGLPTIVTTNVPLKSWGETYGEAMESFAHEAFLPINIVSTEGDRRKHEG